MNRRPQRNTGPRGRRRKRYRISVGRLVLSFLLLLLVSEIALVGLTSPWFNITAVRIEGTRTMTRAQVMQYVKIPPKTNLFRLKTRPIVESLERNPLVKSAVVRKVVPGSVVVKIAERRPRFALHTHGKYYLADSAGIPFRIVPQLPENMTVISCRVPQRIVLGRPLTTRAFRSARECLLMAQRKKNFVVSKISVDHNGDLCLNTRDGLEARLGQPVQLAEKLDKVDQAIAQIPIIRYDTEYIDVTCPQEPAFRPRKKP